MTKEAETPVDQSDDVERIFTMTERTIFEGIVKETFAKIAKYDGVRIINIEHFTHEDPPCSSVSLCRSKEGNKTSVGGTVQISKLKSGTMILGVIELGVSFALPEQVIEAMKDPTTKSRILQSLTTILRGGGIFEYNDTTTPSFIVRTAYVLPEECNDRLDAIIMQLIGHDFVDYLAITVTDVLNAEHLLEMNPTADTNG